MTHSKQEFENLARPLAEELIKYAMENGKDYGITDAAVGISTSTEQDNSVENGQVTSSVTGTSWSVSVTLYAGDKPMSFSKNTLDLGKLYAAIDQNMQVIHLVPDNKDQKLLESERVYKGPVDDLDLFDENPPSQEELIDYAKKMEAAAFAQPGIKTARESSVSQNTSHSLAIATNGVELLNSKTMFQASISAIAEDGNGMEVAYDYSIARHFNDMAAPEEVGLKAAEKALSKLGASLPDSTSAPIILSREAAATFFGSVFAAIDGTAVYRGTTFLKDKVGEQIMSKGITIEDDPRIPKAVNSRNLDGSGMEAKKITFIKDGVLQGYNVSLSEARKLGIEPIGRSSGTSNIRVLNGDKTPGELVQDVGDGFYIKGFQGGSANVNNGVFSRQAYGTLIKDGKITNTPVSGFVVSGNLKDMFMNVTLANDAPELPDTRHTASIPTARIDGMKIAGR